MIFTYTEIYQFVIPDHFGSLAPLLLSSSHKKYICCGCITFTD